MHLSPRLLSREAPHRLSVVFESCVWLRPWWTEAPPFLELTFSQVSELGWQQATASFAKSLGLCPPFLPVPGRNSSFLYWKQPARVCQDKVPEDCVLEESCCPEGTVLGTQHPQGIVPVRPAARSLHSCLLAIPCLADRRGVNPYLDSSFLGVSRAHPFAVCSASVVQQML